MNLLKSVKFKFLIDDLQSGGTISWHRMPLLAENEDPQIETGPEFE